jgi:hypothetical protein
MIKIIKGNGVATIVHKYMDCCVEKAQSLQGGMQTILGLGLRLGF